MAGFPVPLAGLAVSLTVLGWCGRFGNRDRHEARTQRATREFLEARRAKALEPTDTPFTVVRLFESGMEAAQGVALLESEGFTAMVKCEATGIFGPGASWATRGIFPTRVLVPTERRDAAADLLAAYFDEHQDAND